jgi:two-component system chemotaxis response regulator CheB
VKRKVRTLIIDDSSYMRYLVSNILTADPEIEVASSACDGLEGLEKIRSLRPDVVILDIEMPKLDGIGVLERLVAENIAIPIVVFSKLAEEGAQMTLRALDLGAVDFITKPKGSDALTLKNLKRDILQKILTASRIAPDRIRQLQQSKIWEKGEREKITRKRKLDLRKVVVIAASTGGPSALEEVIPRLPEDFPAGLAVVQHMPEGFTATLARRLDSLSAIDVREAEKGDKMEPALALIAPGGFHMKIESGNTIELNREMPVNGVRPAADVTMESAAKVFGERAIAVVLTGMGFDGTKGAHHIRKAGGRAIAEDPRTCIVDGMPSSLIKSGNADLVVPLQEMASTLAEIVKGP